MVRESPGQHPVPVTLPPALDEWLAEHADEAGIDRGELLVQLAATYRAAAEDGAAAGGLVNAVEEAATDAATERVDDRLDSFRSSLDSQLQVIRKRVVQLKRESDEKAEANRVNELSTRADGLDERLGDVDERLDDLEDAVGTLREEVEERPTDGDGPGPSAPRDADADRGDAPGGRDGTALDPGIVERLDDVESKLVRVARAVVELREEHPPGATGDGALRELKHAAAREGVREARCAGCEGTVDLALLPEAVCPHCDAPVRGLAVGGTDDGTGEGRARLEVAREGGSADETDEAEGTARGSAETAVGEDGDDSTDAEVADR
jgi:hypothetical protein